MRLTFSILGLALASVGIAAPPGRCPGPSRSTTGAPTPTCTYSICEDRINECGMGYGGCFLAPECGGTWPTFTPPPCPTTTTTSSCNFQICADYINSCGIWYGGCFLAPECGGTWPSFTAPPCPSTTTTASQCSYTLCADYVNSCGYPYGGCFLAPECGGVWPTTWNTPPCTSSTLPPSSSSFPTWCAATSTICTDRYNPCSPYNIGTCYVNPLCGGTSLEPVNTVCSTSTTISVTTTLPRYGYEVVKRTIEWYSWTTTIPEATPTPAYRHHKPGPQTIL
ncbi:hypothetical protein BDZ91DRAFT_718539 [Kalaharituber pfeilii]|nr:hypothetical protein BDZ91DRAFT_718539 [Kalaharituber pfeilii]